MDQIYVQTRIMWYGVCLLICITIYILPQLSQGCKQCGIILEHVLTTSEFILSVGIFVASFQALYSERPCRMIRISQEGDECHQNIVQND